MQQRGQGDSGATIQDSMQQQGQGDSDAINQSESVEEQQVLFDSNAPIKVTTPLSTEEFLNARLTGSSTITHSEGHKSPCMSAGVRQGHQHKSPYISAEAYPGL